MIQEDQDLMFPENKLFFYLSTSVGPPLQPEWQIITSSCSSSPHSKSGMLFLVFFVQTWKTTSIFYQKFSPDASKAEMVNPENL
jgi:hypothetical protein